MKYIIRILFLLIICFSNKAFSQDFNTENLFYCQKDLDIKNIWLFADQTFVANVRYTTENNRTYGNLFLLFDKQNLIVDSLYLKSGFLNSFDIINSNEFYLSSSLYTEKFSIQNGFFESLEKRKIKTGMQNLINADFSNYELGYFYEVIVGYETKAKNRLKIKSKKQVPRFFYKSNSDTKQWVNSGNDEVIFDQWVNFFDKSLFETGRVQMLDRKIFVDIPVIGKCFILNINSGIIDEIRYPNDDVKSWLFVIDKKTKAYYLVGHKGNLEFTVNQINKETHKLTWLKDVYDFYDLIFDDKILIKKSLGGETCYYLEPLF